MRALRIASIAIGAAFGLSAVVAAGAAALLPLPARLHLGPVRLDPVIALSFLAVAWAMIGAAAFILVLRIWPLTVSAPGHAPAERNPSAPPNPRGDTMRTAMLLAVGLGITACAATVQSGPPSGSEPVAEAGAVGEEGAKLVLEPRGPAAGERIEATYHPVRALTGERRLHLRARLRTPQSDDYNHGMGSRTLAELERQPDGTYRGSFALPPDVVYAALAVEDADAERVDSREGRFWELMARGPDGRPLLAALEQRIADHMGRDDLAILETAREAARLYPDEVSSWTMLRFAENMVLGDEEAEEQQERHRERLLRFDRGLHGEQGIAADQIGYLYWYARILGEEEIANRWHTRLMGEHPEHFFAVQNRVMELRRELGEEPTTLLAALETIWEATSDHRARERIVGPAFAAARQTGDPAAILRWADRSVELNPQAAAMAAVRAAETEATRDEGLARLRLAVSEMDLARDRDRELGATTEEHRRHAARRAAVLRTSLGQTLLAAGRTGKAVDALERAAEEGWATGRFRSLGEARLASGDHAGAIRAFAAVAADPATSAETSDSLRHALGRGLEVSRWNVAVERARREMLERTLASARTERLAPVRVALRDGTSTGLDRLLGEDASVVVFWSRYCGFSVQTMPRIAALADHLAEEGIPLLAVTRDPPNEAEPYLEDGEWDLEVLFDTEGEAARALNSWGTPQYFVLDGEGRLRFAFSSLDDLPRQVIALRERETSSAVPSAD